MVSRLLLEEHVVPMSVSPVVKGVVPSDTGSLPESKLPETRSRPLCVTLALLHNVSSGPAAHIPLGQSQWYMESRLASIFHYFPQFNVVYS